MATIGTITQLPKQFFLDAATLAGDGKQALSEQTGPTAGDQEEEAAADVAQNRQARAHALMVRHSAQSHPILMCLQRPRQSNRRVRSNMCDLRDWYVRKSNQLSLHLTTNSGSSNPFDAGVSSPAFESQTEQRLHFKGDWHRFNVKLRSVGKAAVDETEFERLVTEKDEVATPFIWPLHMSRPACILT